MASDTAWRSLPANPAPGTAHSSPMAPRAAPAAQIRIGVSGWRYAPWRGTFYPDDLA